MLRALAHSNYRRFFAGQTVSLVGTWMQQVAMSWLVFHLTGSGWMLGIIGFASNFPNFVLVPFAGVWSDRGDRRRLLIIGQVVLLTQAALMAALTLLGIITVWMVVALSAVAGVANAVCNTIQQAFVVDMVERREDLTSAIGLNSFMNNAARMVGPSLGGLLIGALAKPEGVLHATGLCFLINAASFLAALAALLSMHLRTVPRALAGSPVWQHLKEGFAYALGFAPIRDVLLVLALVGLMTVPYTLMPLVAKDMLAGGAQAVGFLMAADGVGAITGAFFLASRRDTDAPMVRIVVMAGISGLAIGAFAFVGSIWPALLFRSIFAFALMVQVTSTNTLLQFLTDDARRGRVMSLFTLSLMGMMPIGSLLMGGLSQWLGLRETFVVNGLGYLLGAIWLAVQLPKLTPLIRERHAQLEAARTEISTSPPAAFADSYHP